MTPGKKIRSLSVRMVQYSDTYPKVQRERREGESNPDNILLKEIARRMSLRMEILLFHFT